MARKDNTLVVVQAAQIVFVKVPPQFVHCFFTSRTIIARKYADDFIRTGLLEIACVFDCLPIGVSAGVVTLQLDNDQFAIKVHRQKV